MRLCCAMLVLAVGFSTCVSLPARADDDSPKEEGKTAAREMTKDKGKEKDKEHKDRRHKDKGKAKSKDKKKDKQHRPDGPGRHHGPPHHRGPGGHAGPRHRLSGDPLRHILLARFDGDHDGKLSDDEWAAVRKKFDESGDKSRGDREHGKHARHHRGGDRHRHHTHHGSHARHHRGPGHHRHGSEGDREFAHRGGPHRFGPPHRAGSPDHALANRDHDGPGPHHARRGPGGPPHGRWHHGPPSEEVRQAMFRRMDKDGDGELSDEERDAARQALHAHWRHRSKGNKEHGEAKKDDKKDDDGDRDREQRRHRESSASADGPRDGGPPHRGDHPRGSESGRARFMQRFDKDGDGKLNEEEGKAAHAAFEEFRRHRDRDDDDDDKQDRPDDKDDRDEDGKNGDRRDDD